jgi:hypothetical protein
MASLHGKYQLVLKRRISWMFPGEPATQQHLVAKVNSCFAPIDKLSNILLKIINSS